MRTRLIPAAVLALAILVAGCGGGGGGTDNAASTGGSPASGASIAPKSATLFARIDTQFDSDQWNSLQTLLEKFPDGSKFLSPASPSDPSLEDFKEALGPETDLVALTLADLSGDSSNLVGLTQPKDKASLDALLAKDGAPAASEQIEDWRVIADDQAAIDRFKQAQSGGTLADNETYKAAADALPAESLVSVYLDGQVLTTAIAKQAKTATGPIPGLGQLSWLAGALSANDKGLTLDIRLKADQIQVAPYAAELPADVPADVSLFVDFKGLNAALDQLRQNPAVSKQLGAAEQALGGLLDDVVGLFKSEGAIYARKGTSGGEYTVLLKADDEQAARQTLDKIGTFAGLATSKAPEAVQVAGKTVQKLTVGSNTIYFGIVDGKIIVTNAESGISGLSSGAKLADSQAWKDAADAADLPDETTGILYVTDVQQLLGLVKSVGGTVDITPEAERNLAALGSVLMYGSVDNDIVSAKGFVSVR